MLADEFKKSKGRPIVVDGKTILLSEELEVPANGKLIITFNGATSEWRQGIWIGHISLVETDLELTIAGQTAPGMVLWEDTSPQTVEVIFSAPQKVINVYNVWDPGMGHPMSLIMGAGMQCEISDDGKRRVYNCNDGHPETTFSHLKFSLEIIPE